MARPKKTVPPKKSHFVGIRLTDDLYDVVSNEATSAKISLSEYFRNLALNHKINVYEEKVFYSKDLLKKLGDLGRIGNNLNQIARHLNEGLPFDANLKKDIYSLIGELYDLRDAILDEAGEYRYGDS